MIHFELLWMVWGTGSTSIFFAYGNPVAPEPFIEKILSPTELFWHHCQSSTDHKFEGLHPKSQFYSIGLCGYPCASTT